MKKIDRILQTKMDRREFLGVMATAAVSVFGLTTILGLFTKDQPQEVSTLGYGEGYYGR